MAINSLQNTSLNINSPTESRDYIEAFWQEPNVCLQELQIKVNVAVAIIEEWGRLLDITSGKVEKMITRRLQQSQFVDFMYERVAGG